jgi:hypothetical protein
MSLYQHDVYIWRGAEKREVIQQVDFLPASANVGFAVDGLSIRNSKSWIGCRLQNPSRIVPTTDGPWLEKRQPCGHTAHNKARLLSHSVISACHYCCNLGRVLENLSSQHAEQNLHHVLRLSLFRTPCARSDADITSFLG